MMKTLEIPEEVLNSARMTIEDIRTELAILLYERERLSIGKARELANMSLWQFRQLLASRQIPVQLDENELEKEIETLRELKRL